jgi:hypothetical protein
MISIKAGKIIIKKDESDPGWELNLDYVKREMLRAVKTARPRSFYAGVVRSIVKDIDSRGVFSLKSAEERIKTLSATREPGVKQCCQQWLQWLSYIKMAAKMKSRAEIKNRYFENYDKIFNQEVMNG